MLYIDGSSNSQGSGAGIILTTLEGIQLEYALRFGFKASNNEVEYEALLVELQSATTTGAKQIRVYNDSQLVVNQVLQQYEAREDNMIAYLALVHAIIVKLKGMSITQILREENTQADRLAHLASSLESDLQGVRIEYLSEPSVLQLERMDVDPIDVGPSWMDPIMMYLTTGTLDRKSVV